MSFAVISGTGLDSLVADIRKKEVIVSTAYGDVFLYSCRPASGDGEWYVLPRHGRQGQTPPHLINYRANVAALKKLGVNQILAFACVGGISDAMIPCTMTMCRQFIDCTYGREGTFSMVRNIAYTDMTEPYCAPLTDLVLKKSAELGISLLDGATYICTQGPRFETTAEIKAYRMWGADVVGMTGVPEATLAKEAGICYASLAIVANYAAGITSAVSASDIDEIMSKKLPKVMAIVRSLSENNIQTHCQCHESKFNLE